MGGDKGTLHIQPLNNGKPSGPIEVVDAWIVYALYVTPLDDWFVDKDKKEYAGEVTVYTTASGWFRFRQPRWGPAEVSGTAGCAEGEILLEGVN